MFYVYQYIDPRSNLPFYIGKGSGDRKFYHLEETIKSTINKRKFFRIQSLKKLGLDPIIEEIAHFDCESDAYQLEESLIKQYGRKGYDPGGILLNISKNSNPPSRKGKTLTEEQKLKMRGRKMSKEHREKLKGRMPWNKGVKGAQVAWNKGMSLGPKTPMTEITKEKLRLCNTGKKKSEETRRKMSKNMKGRVPWNKGKTGIRRSGKPVVIESPQGQEYHYDRLKDGCKELGLTYTHMSSVNSGKKSNWKGWTVRPLNMA
jgi:hypothetical protein